jgi:hypothetical protein
MGSQGVGLVRRGQEHAVNTADTRERLQARLRHIAHSTDEYEAALVRLERERDAVAAALEALKVAERAIQKVDVHVVTEALPRGLEGRVLLAVRSSAGATRARDIANALGENPHPVASALCVLAKRGLIQRAGHGLYGPLPTAKEGAA